MHLKQPFFFFLFLTSLFLYSTDIYTYQQNLHTPVVELFLFSVVCSVFLSLGLSFVPVKKYLSPVFALWGLFLLSGLTILFGTLFILNQTSCHHKTDWLCVAQKAIQTQNPDLCDQTVKDYCLLQYSRTHGDKLLCDRVDPTRKERCISNIARHTGDVELCFTLSSLPVINECLTKIAVSLNDEKICEKIKGNADYKNCRSYLGSEEKRKKYLDSRYYM